MSTHVETANGFHIIVTPGTPRPYKLNGASYKTKEAAVEAAKAKELKMTAAFARALGMI